MALAGLVALGLLLGSARASGSAAAPDPERNGTSVTGWHWRLNQSKEALSSFAQEQGERVFSIEVESVSPERFSAVLVKNTGAYARSGGWTSDLSAAAVIQKMKDVNGRIIDLEPYTKGGARRFAVIWVANTGAAQKGWWWNYDLTVSQVTGDINKHKIRLVDLDTYLVNGQRRYSYVGIGNKGVDASAWWWYPDASPEFVGQKLKEFGARLIDVAPASPGRLAVIMQKNAGTYWWWGLGLSASRVEEVYETHGVRIVDLERYEQGGETLYAFVAVDNADGESARLRSYLDKAYDNEAQFGKQVIRGVYVKQIGGPVLARIAASLRFQPLSTLKLLPYAYAWEQIDQGKATLDTTVSWVEATKDDPSKVGDERKYAGCLKPRAADTKSGSAKWRDALPTMMWESHNRTLDSFLDTFKPDTLTTRAQQAWGLADTEMHFGCPQADSQAPWAANRSTLVDFGKLFEGIDRLEIVKKTASRDGFFANMINLNYGGASYMSPITGATTGPLNVTFLREIVKREAGASKQGIVEEFLKGIVIRGKGGSGGPADNEVGYSDFLHVTLPFRVGGRVVRRTFVVGWFVYKLTTPAGCLDLPKSQQSSKCNAIWQPERDALGTLKVEIYALPIRLALKTWP